MTISLMKRYVLSAILGGASALDGYVGLTKLLEYTDAKAAVLQAQLTNTAISNSQLEQIMQNYSADYFTGLFFTAVAGAAGISAIFLACNED